MTILVFDKKEVEALLSKLQPSDPVMLVGDQGVYLMSFKDSVDDYSKRTIVYAEGCHPEKDEDFYETKRALFGGDDGADEIGTAESLGPILAQCRFKLFVRLGKTTLMVTSSRSGR